MAAPRRPFPSGPVFSTAAALLLLSTGCAAPASDMKEGPGTFGSRFIALSDADMTASAYADGRLEPIEDRDTLSLVDATGVQAAAFASNSVISWPQVMAASPDGRYVYVIETKGEAPAQTSRYDSVYSDFPTGHRLFIYAVGENSLALVDTLETIALNPQSVETGPGFLVLASEDPDREIVIVPLSQNRPAGPARHIDLALDYRDSDEERRIRGAHLSADGQTLAVNIANRRVQFFRLQLDAQGLPSAATPVSRPSEDLGRRLAAGKWTPDGRHFLITDTNWARSNLHMLTQGPGTVHVLAPPDRADQPPVTISTQRVGRSPEGFSISADGTRVATINMERTYLPDGPLPAWPGRNRYSVSLLSLSADGMLSELDRIYQDGILPEDVIFDAAGDNLAVAVFHRSSGPDRQRGFIDYFSIDSDRLSSQGRSLPVIRGAHDLVRLPN